MRRVAIVLILLSFFLALLLPESDPPRVSVASGARTVSGAEFLAEPPETVPEPTTTTLPPPPTTEAPRAVQAPMPVVVTGGCCQHSDAWWHGVAICEQGGRNDPYFGYFSWMDGSMGGLPWDVQVAASNALLARMGREIGPWAESCVNAGYRASPGG